MVRQFSTTIRRRSLSSFAVMFTTLTLITLLADFAYSSGSCYPGLKSVGETVPRGNIVLEYGSGVPLEITCILQSDTIIVQNVFRDIKNISQGIKFPSHSIVFYKNAEIVPKQYVTILNQTAAQLRIPNPPAGHDIYHCILSLDYERHEKKNNGNFSSHHSYIMSSHVLSMLPTVQYEVTGSITNGSHLPESQVGVCFNNVYVGYKPAVIRNFACISKNWVNMRCSWNISENPIKTTYTLLFRLPDGNGGRIINGCPTDSDNRENACYWDLNTTPVYRPNYEFYDFRLNGQNVLGNSSSFFSFHHYANIIPANPTNITVVEKTESSAMLRWSVGNMTYFPKELFHKIEYKSQWDSNSENWHTVITSDVNCEMPSPSKQTNSHQDTKKCQEFDNDYYYFNVTDLKYPSTEYNFRIYVRSSIALGEDKWSPPGNTTLKTKPSIPRRPPRTDIGSFESLTSRHNKSKRTVFIYWQKINDSEKCGDSFEYRAYYTSTAVQNESTIHYSNEICESYAKFQELSTSADYTFVVYSSNSEGLSTEYSTIYVPSESESIEKPTLLTKTVFDQQGVFELSWKNSGTAKLSTVDELSFYTLFWCENINRHSYECNGYMNWTHVPSSELRCNVTIFDYNIKNHYQFAISANSQCLISNGTNSYNQINCKSSGMVWESCIIQNNITKRKFENVWVNVISSTFIGLRWNVDCMDKIGLDGEYQIFYCVVVSIKNNTCKGSMLSKTISREAAQKDGGFTLLTNLEPNTTYIVSITIYTMYDKTLHSDPLLITTLGLGGGWYLKQEYPTSMQQIMKHYLYP